MMYQPISPTREDDMRWHKEEIQLKIYGFLFFEQQDSKKQFVLFLYQCIYIYLLVTLLQMYPISPFSFTHLHSAPTSPLAITILLSLSMGYDLCQTYPYLLSRKLPEVYISKLKIYFLVYASPTVPIY